MKDEIEMKAPVSRVNDTGAKQSGRSGFDSGRSKEKWKVEFWLHIFDGGRERRYDTRPVGVPTLAVTVLEDVFGRAVQETRTASIWFDGPYEPGKTPVYTRVHPRGKDWQFIYEDYADGFSVWRRPHSEGGQ